MPANSITSQKMEVRPDSFDLSSSVFNFDPSQYHSTFFDHKFFYLFFRPFSWHPFFPEEVSDLFGREEWMKESASIQYLSLTLVILPTKSFSVKIKQKSSLNQTIVKGVLVVGLQKPSTK